MHLDKYAKMAYNRFKNMPKWHMLFNNELKVLIIYGETKILR